MKTYVTIPFLRSASDDLTVYDNPLTVYRYFDSRGRLLYVGMTGFGALRGIQHSSMAAWWPRVARATFEHYATREAALEAERIAIEIEAPAFNRPTGNAPRPRRWKIRRLDPPPDPRDGALLEAEIAMDRLLATLRSKRWPQRI